MTQDDDTENMSGVKRFTRDGAKGTSGGKGKANRRQDGAWIEIAEILFPTEDWKDKSRVNETRRSQLELSYYYNPTIVNTIVPGEGMER